MHELSVAMSIVKAAEEGARKNNAFRINLIHLEIGSMAGIEMDALEFAWPMAVKNTMLEKAEKIFEVIPAVARCPECHEEYPVKNAFDACPNCGSYFKEYIKGKELKIKYLEIEK